MPSHEKKFTVIDGGGKPNTLLPQPDLKAHRRLKKRRGNALPYNLPPRGVDREEAAAYCGVGETYFNQMVADGWMPKPWRMGSRPVWDLRKIDRALDKLDTEDTSPDIQSRMTL